MTSNWFAFHVGLEGVVSENDPQADLTGHLLFEMGANGLEWRASDDGLEVVAALRSGPDGLENLLSAVWKCTLEADLPVGWVRAEPYADVDWSIHWREHFKPLCFKDKSKPDSAALWIVPSWLEPPAGATTILRIDPSSAFGTGIHATTSLCVEWLMENRLSSVLDIGTGTGVLAFVGAILGAQPVVAIDNDPEAVRVATQNRDLNVFAEHQIDISGNELAQITGQFQTVVANVLAQPLIELAPDIVPKVAAGGRLGLSGVLASQVDEVTNAYVSRGMTLAEVRHQGEWVLIALVA
ncbi:MAG: 50S ribosomal protein L11 methyltransferase [Myxococcales bacterium]|nr:50S ribosomal protein L11 methyltransferase [Myxococcales bacterium]